MRNHYLSLDPYMRGRMNDVKSYAAKQEIDQVMVGGTVGEVIESKNPKFKVGDIVAGPYGWQQYGVFGRQRSEQGRCEPRAACRPTSA